MPFVVGWLLNGVYLLLLLAVSPILMFRRITQGKYRRGWGDKLTGRISRRHPEKHCIWFHAVSVGEVVQLQKILEEAEHRFPDSELLVTVTTETGYDVARDKYPRHTIAYFPLDFTWAVDTALKRIHPDLIVLIELELWPNFILTAARRRIPLMLLNGRIGEKSFRGYSKVKPLMRRLLACIDVLAVQNETYAERLRSLGAAADRVVVTGNIKFDRVESNRQNPKTQELRTSFGFNSTDRILIAGSTQAPEEAYAIKTWQSLRAEFPELRLILVPRHKERFDEVAELIQERGYTALRRSELKSHGSDSASNPAFSTIQPPAIALLDTLGELAVCWGLADIAFVGGSLENDRGGQNMIEPAGYGAAVLFGPNTWNFKDITQALLLLQAAQVVTSRDSLQETVRHLLRHGEEAERMGVAARTFVAAQQGATNRSADLMAQIVNKKSD